MTRDAAKRQCRRVAVVTGTRAEYGLLRSTIAAIGRHPKLTLQLAVTGTHLLRRFGHTVDEIVRDGWRIDTRVKMQMGNDDPLDQARGLSRGVDGLASFFERAETDIILVLGDRIEAMAGALAAVTTGRVLAHMHGGDLAPGDFDDSLRHAISKLAHVHFPATEQSKRRLVRMGEHANRVHCVGAPGLDRLVELIRTRKPPPSDRDHRALVVQHPCGRSANRERKTMRLILDAVDDAGLASTIIHPNSDRGHSGVVQAIEAFSERRGREPDVEVVRSLAHDRYLEALMDADVLVGNSSSGIIEAGTAGTPAVNVGPRQAGRQPSGRSVVDAKETTKSIRTALARALRKRPIIGGRTVYGDGSAGRRTAAILARMPITATLRQKANAY